MKVTVFGGSKPLPGETAYQEAYQLGNLLGEAGHTVLTGGYCGTMEAVSRGAAEAGGHVIGVTCDEIEKWRPTGPNEWVAEVWRNDTLIDRMMALITGCDAAIALPGGIGTLTEILVLWDLLLIKAVTHPPMILIGSAWRTILQNFGEQQQKYFSGAEWQSIKFAANPHEAFQLLEKSNG